MHSETELGRELLVHHLMREAISMHSETHSPRGTCLDRAAALSMQSPSSCNQNALRDALTSRNLPRTSSCSSCSRSVDEMRCTAVATISLIVC
jgi:hypothetical protein